MEITNEFLVKLTCRMDRIARSQFTEWSVSQGELEYLIKKAIQDISGQNFFQADIDNDVCPICGESPTLICRCPRADKTCANGHSWHICVIHGCVVQGNSDHSLPTNTCTCNQEKK